LDIGVEAGSPRNACSTARWLEDQLWPVSRLVSRLIASPLLAGGLPYRASMLGSAKPSHQPPARPRCFSHTLSRVPAERQAAATSG